MGRCRIILRYSVVRRSSKLVTACCFVRRSCDHASNTPKSRIIDATAIAHSEIRILIKQPRRHYGQVGRVWPINGLTQSVLKYSFCFLPRVTVKLRLRRWPLVWLGFCPESGRLICRASLIMPAIHSSFSALSPSDTAATTHNPNRTKTCFAVSDVGCSGAVKVRFCRDVQMACYGTRIGARSY